MKIKAKEVLMRYGPISFLFVLGTTAACAGCSDDETSVNHEEEGWSPYVISFHDSNGGIHENYVAYHASELKSGKWLKKNAFRVLKRAL